MSRTKLERAKTSVEKPRAKKPLKKYGTESRSQKYSDTDIFVFHGDGDEGDEDVKAPGRRVKSSDTADKAVRSSDRSEDGSMQPPSSKLTPPKRSQHLDESSAPSVVNPPNASRSLENESPIARSVSSTPETLGRPARASINPSQGNRAEAPCHEQDLVNAAQISRKDISDRPTLNPGHSSGTTTMHPTNAVDEAMVMSDHYGADKHSLQSATIDDINDETTVTKPQLSHSSYNCAADGLSLQISGPPSWSINQTTMSKSQKSKLDESQPGPDEHGLGGHLANLPKEQHQAQQSKNGSFRADNKVPTPTDLSKRPEAAAEKKRKTKRRKTTAFHELIPKDEDEESADEISHKSKIKTVKPDLYLPSEDPPKEGRGVEDSTKDTNREELSHEITDPKPVEKKKKGRGRPKKGAADDTKEIRKDEFEEPDSAEPTSFAHKTNDKNPTSKRKRGKADSAHAAISEELVQESEDELAEMEKRIQQPVESLNQIPQNTLGSGDILDCKGSPSPTKAKSPAPQTPRKADSNTGKGPDKHSPISSGKVSYRVGLSKRARITPLLRIVRKV